MADMIGVAYNSGSVSYSTPLTSLLHGPVDQSPGTPHTIHYGSAHLKMKRISTSPAEDGEGVIVGRIGTGSGEGSTLQLESFTTAERGYLSASAGMLIYNETTGLFEGYTTEWAPLAGGGLPLQRSDLTTWHDTYTGTEGAPAPSYGIGTRIGIYTAGAVKRGEATVIYYNASGTPTIKLIDNDAKGLIVATDKIYDTIDNSGNYLTVGAVVQELSTDGVQNEFIADLDGYHLTVNSIQVMRNGVLQRRVDTAAQANNYGPNAYLWDATEGSETIKFGTSHPPARGEVITLIAITVESA